MFSLNFAGPDAFCVLSPMSPLLHDSDAEASDGLPMDFSNILARLHQSRFRARFHLSPADHAYALAKGEDVLRVHATGFIEQRLAPSEPPNDGKQTPMRGHPVFVAQHACACCCRSCLAKWHHIAPHRPLTAKEKAWIVELLLAWIREDLKNPPSLPTTPSRQGSLF